jgi:spermidine/putrescine transport system ATP-binding protein
MLKDYAVRFADTVFECVDKGFNENESVEVVIRPEDIAIVPENTGAINGIVQNVTFKGVHYEMLIAEQHMTWKIHSTVMSPVGRAVGMNIAPDLIHVMRKGEPAA